MRSVARFVTGRRTKWLVPLIWLVVVIALAPLGSKLSDATSDEAESFLPESAESTEVVRLLEDRVEGGQSLNGLIVYERDGGLTPADREKIASDAREVQEKLPLVTDPVVPFETTQEGLVSPDGSVAYTVLTVPDDFEQHGEWGKDVREIAGDGDGSLNVYLTGDLGVNADFEEVFADLDTTLVLVTALLVIVLLLLIYRAPLIALMPLVVVAFSFFVAQGFVYLYADSGATVSSNSVFLLTVLMFGVGTDYCLLFVSRYREELRRMEDKHAAAERALRRVMPALIASGLTVAVAMLILLVADTKSISSLGPVAAIGVACCLTASLTMLPALLTIVGRRGFWPRRSLVEYDPEHETAERRGVWQRFGERVLQRPAAALALTLLLFAGGALGLLAYEEDFSSTNVFKEETESIDGFETIERAFPPGVLSPTQVVLVKDSGPVTDAEIQAARNRLEGVDGVAASVVTRVRSEDGGLRQIDVVPEDDPLSKEGLATIPRMREAVDETAPGVRALVGGSAAVTYDFDEAASTDLKRIVPLSLVAIALILAVLLQALVAPLVLIGTVIASFFGTLGLSLLFIRYVVDDPGVDSSLPVFAFIFLVALGIDYTIFLMSRVREEARVHGTRDGVLRALGATGPVITSAGIILAGTFAVLMTLPVTFVFNIGFIIAVGILLDTFVVRTIMVPAAVELIGDKIWWPSGPGGGGAVLREQPAEPEPEPDAPIAGPEKPVGAPT